MAVRVDSEIENGVDRSTPSKRIFAWTSNENIHWIVEIGISFSPFIPTIHFQTFREVFYFYMLYYYSYHESSFYSYCDIVITNIRLVINDSSPL
jgi:hypothetical protein